MRHLGEHPIPPAQLSTSVATIGRLLRCSPPVTRTHVVAEEDRQPEGTCVVVALEKHVVLTLPDQPTAKTIRHGRPSIVALKLAG